MGALGLALALPAAAQPGGGATVEVDIANVRHAAGHVRVNLCTKATFLKSGCPYAGAAPAQVGVTVVTLTGVAPGDYAAQAFDDDTDGGKVHQGLFGIPREGIGISNDAPVHITGPRFREAAFTVGQDGARIALKLRYFHGDGVDRSTTSRVAVAEELSPRASQR